MRSFFKFSNILLTLACLLIASCSPKDKYISFSGYAQGGTYTVKINLNGKDGMIRKSPRKIQKAVDTILGNIDNSLSGYNKNSILSRFNDGETVIPDYIFINIYERAYHLYEETEGIVDVASAPLFDIWGFGFKNGELPSDDKLMEVMEGCGMKLLKRDMRTSVSEGNTLNGRTLLKCDDGSLPKLNYNAIAQGYSCDLVAEYLYSIGVKDMLVDIGEIFCDGLNPNGKSWSLGIDRPADGNNNPGEQLQGIFHAPEGPHGIVTSGNYRKYYIRDGKKYAHTIDPRTGRPVNHTLLSATIVAPDATTADAYATYCMVVGLEESKKLLTENEQLEGCLIYDDNGTFATWCSEGFVLNNL